MDYQIPALEKDVVVETEKETFTLTDLINVIIEFINKLLKFEF